MPGSLEGRYRSVVPVLVAVLVLVVDQLTKLLAIQYLGPASSREFVNVIGSWLRFSYATNSGAAFGILQDRTLFFTIIALVAIPVLIFFHNSLPRDSWLARSCIGLLMGGTVGNLVDRLHYGYVIDFIDAGAGNLRWPTFNVADSAFVVGVLILAAYLLFLSEPKRAS